MYKYEYNDWFNFGKRVRMYRKSLGLTIEQLAELTDRTVNYINRIENGEKSCSIHTIHQLSKSLRVSTDVLLYGELVKKEEEYSNKQLIDNIISHCSSNELEVIKNVIIALYPKFKDIIEE